MEVSKSVHQSARAKVNLFLNVKGRRPDGYHDLEMINARITLADELTFTLGGDDPVTIRSNDPFLENRNNLVYFIARDLMESHAPGSRVIIEIDKRIPAGAGLAGNSADAAAVIRGLDDLFEWKWTQKAMQSIGLQYGADIPYCLESHPALVEGVGDRITPLDLDLSEYALLLVKPKAFVATDQVFKLGDQTGFVAHDIRPVLEAIHRKNLPEMIRLLQNSLEEITFRLSPGTKEAKDLLISLTGSDGVVMTGSGATVIKIVNKNAIPISDQLFAFSDKFSINIYNFS